MTFPGRLYLLDPSRDWPGDTLNPDGTARTPLWTKETHITPDQYEVVKDVSKRKKYGTFISLAAKEEPNFITEWLPARRFRRGNERNLSASSVRRPAFDLRPWPFNRRPYGDDRNTTIPNIMGVLGYGSNLLANMVHQTTGDTWDFPFNYLRLRTWRDTARYIYDALKDKGYGLPC